MPLPRPASPRVFWADLRAVVQERSPIQWIAAAGAVAITIGILVLFVIDGRTNILPGEQITYVESWRADRGDEEIKAAIAKNQADKEAALAERRRQFKRLEKRFGME